MTCLFVGNLTKSVSEPKLINTFSAIGKCKVELKGPYAFIEYDNQEDAKEAMRKFNKTNLNGVNGYAKARIEFSKKKRVNDKLEDNHEFETSDMINISESSSLNNSKEEKQDNYLDIKHYDRHKKDKSQNEERDRNRTRSREVDKDKGKDRGRRDRDKEKHKDKNRERDIKFFKDPEPQKRNVCFICKLPGHFAKECVLTRDSCYECGEKGHIAKECQAGVREAKVLTKNRVKAIFSQQSAYKFITPQTRLNNIINYLKSTEVSDNKPNEY